MESQLTEHHLLMCQGVQMLSFPSAEELTEDREGVLCSHVPVLCFISSIDLNTFQVCNLAVLITCSWEMTTMKTSLSY